MKRQRTCMAFFHRIGYLLPSQKRINWLPSGRRVKDTDFSGALRYQKM